MAAKRVRLGFSVTQETRERLETCAGITGVSMTAFVEELVERHALELAHERIAAAKAALEDARRPGP